MDRPPDYAGKRLGQPVANGHLITSRIASAQLYMLIVASQYNKAQQVDRARYNSFYESANPLTSDIPMKSRSDPYNNHHRKKDSEVSNRSTDQLNPQEPRNAYTYEPTPTPGFNRHMDDDHGMTQVPPRSQPHIGES